MADQTINCVTGVTLTAEEAAKPGMVLSGTNVTLTLNSSLAQAECCAKVCGSLGLTLNATEKTNVQSFNKRTNTTTGALTVTKGVFEIGEGASFPNVSGVSIGAEGELRVTTMIANPIPTTTVLDLPIGAKISVASGASVTVASVRLDGVPITVDELRAAGMLTGEGTLQITGLDPLMIDITEDTTLSALTAKARYTSSNGSTLTLNLASDTTFDGAFAGNLKVKKIGAGALTLNGSVPSSAPAFYVEKGSVTLNSLTASGNITLWTTNMTTLTVSTLTCSGSVYATVNDRDTDVKNGTVTIGTTSGFTGGTIEACSGTLEMSDLSYIQNPTNLIVGYGTLYYTGAATTNSLALKTDIERRTSVVKSDNNWMISCLTNLSDNGYSGLLKVGDGNVTIGGTDRVVLSSCSEGGNTGDDTRISSNGDSPSNRFKTLSSAQGLLAIGVKDDSNHAPIIDCSDRTISAVTPQSSEDATLSFDNGVVTNCETIFAVYRPRNIQSTMTGTVRWRGGKTYAKNLYGNYYIDSDKTTAKGNAEFIMEDGEAVFANQIVLSYHRWADNMKSRLLISGGKMTAKSDLFLAASQTFKCADCYVSVGPGTLSVRDIILHRITNSTYNVTTPPQTEIWVHTGGTLQYRELGQKSDAPIVGGSIYGNGGVWQPVWNAVTVDANEFATLEHVYASTNGFKFSTPIGDMAGSPAWYTIVKGIEPDPVLTEAGVADGGFEVMRGQVRLAAASTFNGPIKVTGGKLSFGSSTDYATTASFVNVTEISVSNGAELRVDATPTALHNDLVLTLEEGAKVDIADGQVLAVDKVMMGEKSMSEIELRVRGLVTGAGTLIIRGAADPSVVDITQDTTVTSLVNNVSFTSSNGSTLTVDLATDMTYSGSFDGSLNLVKAGASELTLTGPSSLTNITVQAGTNTFQTGGSWTNIHSITMGATGVLRVLCPAGTNLAQGVILYATPGAEIRVGNYKTLIFDRAYVDGRLCTKSALKAAGVTLFKDRVDIRNQINFRNPDGMPYICVQGTSTQHLQGVTSDGTHLYATYAYGVVKADFYGTVVQACKTARHLGDPTFYDNKLFVPQNTTGTFDGTVKPDNKILVYMNGDLSLTPTTYSLTNGWRSVENEEGGSVEEADPTCGPAYGVGGLTYKDGFFYVVGGLPDGTPQNYVYKYSFDPDRSAGEEFQLESVITIPIFTGKGIQTAAALSDGRLWFGTDTPYNTTTYPKATYPVATLVCNGDASDFHRVSLKSPYGILEHGGSVGVMKYEGFAGDGSVTIDFNDGVSVDNVFDDYKVGYTAGRVDIESIANANRTVGTLAVASTLDSGKTVTATVEVVSRTLTVTNVATLGGADVGQLGRLVLDGGTVAFTKADGGTLLTVGAAAATDRRGEILGHGTFTATAANAGIAVYDRVIADGDNLDLRAFTSVTEASNMTVPGWYAQNGGCLKLPTVSTTDSTLQNAVNSSQTGLQVEVLAADHATLSSMLYEPLVGWTVTHTDTSLEPALTFVHNFSVDDVSERTVVLLRLVDGEWKKASDVTVGNAITATGLGSYALALIPTGEIMISKDTTVTELIPGAHYTSTNGSTLIVKLTGATEFTGGFNGDLKVSKRESGVLTLSGTSTTEGKIETLAGGLTLAGASLANVTAMSFATNTTFEVTGTPTMSEDVVVTLSSADGTKPQVTIASGQTLTVWQMKVGSKSQTESWLRTEHYLSGDGKLEIRDPDTKSLVDITENTTYYELSSQNNYMSSNGSTLTVELGAGTNVVYDGQFRPDLTVVKTGAGTLTLRSKNTATNIVVSGGVLAIGRTWNALPGTTVLRVNGSGSVDVPAGTYLTVSEAYLNGERVSAARMRVQGAVTGEGRFLVTNEPTADGLWTATASGLWTKDGNWFNGIIPVGLNGTAYFMEQTKPQNEPIAVSVPWMTEIGALVVSNSDYRITAVEPDGHLYLNRASASQLRVIGEQGSGSLTIESPVVSPVSPVTVNAFSTEEDDYWTNVYNCGKVVWTNESFTGAANILEHRYGYLDFPTAASLAFVTNAKQLVIGGLGTVRYTGTGVVDIAGFTIDNALYNGASSFAVQYAAATVSVSKVRTEGGKSKRSLYKSGAGTLKFSGTETSTIGGGLIADYLNATNQRFGVTANGSMGTNRVMNLTVAEGKVVVGTVGDPTDAPQIKVAYGASIGSYGLVGGAEMELNNGSLTVTNGSFSVGFYTFDNPSAVWRLTVNGGMLTVADNDFRVMFGVNAQKTYDLDKGSADIVLNDGIIDVSRNVYLGFNQSRLTDAYARLTMTGGLFRVGNKFLCSGQWGSTPAYFIGNGGRLEIANSFDVSYNKGTAKYPNAISFNTNFTVCVPTITSSRHSSNNRAKAKMQPTARLTFNGGTWEQPFGTDATIVSNDAVTVAAGGLTILTTNETTGVGGANILTFDQAVGGSGDITVGGNGRFRAGNDFLGSADYEYAGKLIITNTVTLVVDNEGLESAKVSLPTPNTVVIDVPANTTNALETLYLPAGTETVSVNGGTLRVHLLFIGDNRRFECGCTSSAGGALIIDQLVDPTIDSGTGRTVALWKIESGTDGLKSVINPDHVLTRGSAASKSFVANTAGIPSNTDFDPTLTAEQIANAALPVKSDASVAQQAGSCHYTIDEFGAKYCSTTNDAFTVEGFFTLTTLPSAGNNVMLVSSQYQLKLEEKGLVDNEGYRWGIVLRGDAGGYRFELRQYWASNAHWTTSDFLTEEEVERLLQNWNHFAVTYEKYGQLPDGKYNGWTRFFLNGKLLFEDRSISCDNPAGKTNYRTALDFGGCANDQQTNLPNSMAGAFDYIRVSDTALDPRYFLDATGYETPAETSTVAYWKLDWTKDGQFNTYPSVGSYQLYGLLPGVSATSPMPVSAMDYVTDVDAGTDAAENNHGCLWAHRANSYIKQSAIGEYVTMTNSFTLEAWIKPFNDETGTSWPQTIFTTESTSNNKNNGWSLRLQKIDGNYYIKGYALANNQSIIGEKGSAVFAEIKDVNSWHHLACVYDRSKGEYGRWTFYLDYEEGDEGVSFDNQDSPDGGTYGSAFWIGTKDVWCFRGYIDQVRLCQAALAPSQFMLFNRGASAPNVLAIWPLDTYSDDSVRFNGTNVAQNAWNLSVARSGNKYKVTKTTNVPTITNPDRTEGFLGNPTNVSSATEFYKGSSNGDCSYLMSLDPNVLAILNAQTDYTIECYARLDQTLVKKDVVMRLFGSYTNVLGKSAVVTSLLGYDTTAGGFVVSNCIWQTAGGASWASLGGAITDSDWHHVALQCEFVSANTARYTLWLDGKSAGSADETIQTTAGNRAMAFFVGGSSATGTLGQWRGAVSSVRVSDRILDPSEFLNAKKEGSAPVVDATTIAYWPLDEEYGKVNAHSLVNGIDANLHGVDISGVPAEKDQAFAFCPNPDRSGAIFQGDPDTNKGCVVMSTYGMLTNRTVASECAFDRAFTIEGWIKFTKEQAGKRYLVCVANEELTRGWALFFDNKALKLSAKTGSDAVPVLVDSETLVADTTDWLGQWKHLALERDTSISGWHLYVDGIPTTTVYDSWKGATGGGDCFCFGGLGLYVHGFIGSYDMWRLSRGCLPSKLLLYADYITLDDGADQVRVVVPAQDSWELAKKGTKEAQLVAISNRLVSVDDNGKKNWINYAMGQGDWTKASVVLTDQSFTNKVGLVPRFETPIQKTGFKVTYECESTKGTVVATNSFKQWSSFDIPLTNGNPTGYYQLKTVLRNTAMADGITTNVLHDKIGVLQVDATNLAQNAIIAVPWEKVGESGAVTVSDVIDIPASGLANGDKLRKYTGTNYVEWILNNGAWEPVTTIAGNGQTEAGDPATTTVSRGEGLWLVRGANSVITNLYQVGRAADTAVTTTLKEKDWSLVASPKIEDFNLYTGLQDPVFNRKTVYEQLRLVMTNGMPRIIKPVTNRTENTVGWGYQVTGTNIWSETINGTTYWRTNVTQKTIQGTEANPIKIPRGTGFFYQDNGKGRKNIKW